MIVLVSYLTLFYLVTELTHSQNEIQQQRQHHMHHQHSVGSDAGQLSMAVNELEMAQNKINQSKKESTEAREQLRALAGKLLSLILYHY